MEIITDFLIIGAGVVGISIAREIKIRNPNAIRPWQHVLDIVNGYLSLAYYLSHDRNLNGMSFNFGPKFKKEYPVIKIAKEIQNNIKDFKYKVEFNKKFKKKN